MQNNKASFRKLLTLAYFREHNDDYSRSELRDVLGVTLSTIEQIIDSLITEEYLEVDNCMIRLTLKGRIKLINSKLENYSFHAPCIFENAGKYIVYSKPVKNNGFKHRKWVGEN